MYVGSIMDVVWAPETKLSTISGVVGYYDNYTN